jgi:hypothetical protein
MPYDSHLADKVRAYLSENTDLEIIEKTMFKLVPIV